MTVTRFARALPVGLVLALGATLAARADDADKDKPRDDSPITVYTPYKNMDEIFKEKGGGVFLPYKELEKLLEQARESLKNPPSIVEPAPPEPFVHVKSSYRGTADESVAHFEATFDFEVLDRKNWVDIPLGLANVSLEEAKTADGKRAVVRQTKSGYAVLTKGSGPLQITAKFTVKINKAVAGQRSFELRLPKAALSTFDVDLPEHGLKVDVQPNLGQQTPSASDSSAKTHVTAYLSPSDQPVTVTWFPRPKEVETGGPQKSLVFSDVATALLLDEGIARALTVVKYVVEQAPQDTFKIQVPKDWKVLDVSAKPAREMRDYDVVEQGGKQVLRVSFHDRQKACEVSFRLERPRDDAAKFEFPSVKTLEAEREKGIIAAASSMYLKLEAAKVTGLSQIDQSEIPGEVRGEVTNLNVSGQRPPLGFRYLKNEYQLELETQKVVPEVDGKVYGLATVKDEEISYAGTIAYEIKKRGIFSAHVKLPAGLTVTDVNERAVKSWNQREATPSDKWTGTILDLDFPGQMNPRPEPYLVTFTGTIPRKSGLTKLDLPVIALDGVNKETGVLAVAAQKHLKLTSASAPTGLVPVPTGELGSLGFPYGAQESEELVFGFKYGKPGAAASIDVAKREPKVTATVEMVANAELDRINVDGDLNYKVEFAGVDKLRVRVPKSLNTDEAFKVTAEGASIKEKNLATPAASDDPDKVIWEIVLQAKREGNFRLHFHYEIKLENMAPGETRKIQLHEIEALDGSRETGDLVLLKHENLVISNDQLTGLETKHATKEMPPSLAKLNGFSGYHWVSHPWKLVLQIIKYDFQAPLQKIIEHLHVDEVVSRDGGLESEAWIRLRNNQGQFLRVLLPAGTEAYPPCLVNEKPVNPSTWGNEKNGIDVMLPEETRRGDAPVLVRIRYRWTKPARSFGTLGSLELGSPTFPTDDKGDPSKAAATGVPVARFTRNVYLPDSVCYVDFDTDMTTHFERGGIFESAKNMIFGHLRESEGASAALQAIQSIYASRSGNTVSSYPPLGLPTMNGGDRTKSGPRLFEKLDCQAKLRVVYASWATLYGLGVLSLVFVVALGAWLEKNARIAPIAYFAVSAGTTFLLAVVASRSVEPFLTTAFVGSIGLGTFWLSRSVWRELTVESHRRKLESLAREAEVAKARAQAAEAEARVGSRPMPAVARLPEKMGTPQQADEAAADRINYDEPKSPPAEGQA